MSSSNPTDQFIEQRSRLLQSVGGIADNNRRVRLLNFERAMKAEFGPNVIVNPDGTATRGTKTVGTLDGFLKAGGQLQGTPKDPRTKLQIKEKEAENFTPPTFDERMDTLFPKAKERLSSTTFESTDADYGSVDLDEMSQYTDTGEQDPGDYTDLENLVSSGSDTSKNNGTSTRDQLKTRAVGPAGISERAPKGYINTGGKFASLNSVEGKRAKMRLDRLRKLQMKIKAGK